jgi:stalled ribosome alternative rescue factor ArfA
VRWEKLRSYKFCKFVNFAVEKADPLSFKGADLQRTPREILPKVSLRSSERVRFVFLGAGPLEVLFLSRQRRKRALSGDAFASSFALASAAELKPAKIKAVFCRKVFNEKVCKNPKGGGSGNRDSGWVERERSCRRLKYCKRKDIPQLCFYPLRSGHYCGVPDQRGFQDGRARRPGLQWNRVRGWTTATEKILHTVKIFKDVAFYPVGFT